MPWSLDLHRPHCQELYRPLVDEAPTVPTGPLGSRAFQTLPEPSLQLHRDPRPLPLFPTPKPAVLTICSGPTS